MPAGNHELHSTVYWRYKPPQVSIFTEVVGAGVEADLATFATVRLQQNPPPSCPPPPEHSLNMDFYSVNVVAFVMLDAALSYLQWKQHNVRANKSKEVAGAGWAESMLSLFKKRFLPVYLLVSGADWLQVCHYQEAVTCILTHGTGSLHISHVQR